MAVLLAKYGFEVIARDGKTPGCFDLDRSSLLDALKRLEERAVGADLALVFFAGHGMAAGEVNIRRFLGSAARSKVAKWCAQEPLRAPGDRPFY